MERKNEMHRSPFGISIEDEDDESLDPNINFEKLKNFCKRFSKKVDAAVSFCPSQDIKLYFFLCEAKKPTYLLENKDYDKLIRLMHDSRNSIIIYYSKRAKYLTRELTEKFKKIVIYGLHIYGNFFFSFFFLFSSKIISISFFRRKGFIFNL